MNITRAFFILRHGSYEGHQKYLEAVKVIEDEYNRQKEELDLAKQAIIALTEERMKLQREIDNECDHCGCVLIDQRDNARADAVKEFAERLQDRMFNYYECVGESARGRPYKGDTLMDYEVVDMIEDSIDNLVKEFTEGKPDGDTMQT